VLRDDVLRTGRSGRRAETLLAAARAYYFGFMGRSVGGRWSRAGQPLREAACNCSPAPYPHIVGVCVEVVQLVYKAAGGGAVYQKGPLDRCLRDVPDNEPARRRDPSRTYEMAGSPAPRSRTAALASSK